MQDTNIELMENMPVQKAIFRLSIPTILSTIVSLLSNLTDIYFIGLLDDPVQLGAISLAFPVFLVMQAVGNVFGNGAPSYISRCLGGRRYNEVQKTSAVSVYMAVILTVIISALFFVFQTPILRLLGTSPDTLVPTKNYLTIIVAFGPVLTLQVIFPALLRAEGKIKEAVTGMVIGTVTNIILDPIFILFLGQKAAGAAWATIIGNALAIFFYLFI